MASCSQPRLQAFFSDDASLSIGMAVKFGTDKKHVTKCTTNTDAVIGVVWSAVTATGQVVEVALPGGGAKFLAGETITKGKKLVPGAAGAWFQTNNSGDSIGGLAMDDAVVNDVIGGEVVFAIAGGADE